MDVSEAALVIFIMGVFVLPICIYRIVKNAKMSSAIKKMEKVEAVAVITKFYGAYGRSLKTYEYSYEYEVDGITFGRDDYKTDEVLNCGDTIDIIYNKNNVNESYAKGEDDSIAISSFFCVLGILMFIGFLIYCVMSIK